MNDQSADVMEIYFKCTGIEDAFGVLRELAPGVDFTPRTSEIDGVTRYLVGLSSGEFSQIASLGPVMNETDLTDTCIDAIDSFGFNIEFGFLVEDISASGREAVIRLAEAISHLRPTALYTDDTPNEGPLLVDTRALDVN